MVTGTLDLSQVDEERRRATGGLDAEMHARLIVEEVLSSAQGAAARQLEELDATPDPRDDDGEMGAAAHRIVAEVLAAEAAADSVVDATPSAALNAGPARTQLVLLSGDDPLVLVPGPVYEPGRGTAWLPVPDRLPQLVDDLVASVRAGRRSVGGMVREAAESPGMPTTRWMLLALVWMAAFASLVPLAFATVGNSLDIQIDLFEEDAPAQQQPPADSAPASAPDAPEG